MGTPASDSVQKRLWTLLRWYKWDLNLLFPHNIDVWMRTPEDYGAGEEVIPSS